MGRFWLMLVASCWPGVVGRDATTDAGGALLCRISDSGSPFCWGSTSPLDVVKLRRFPANGDAFTVVSAGSSAACASAATFVECWGHDAITGVYTDLAGVQSMSTGGAHACALVADSLRCIGDNSFGQRSPPSGTYVSVTSGDSFSCALRLDGFIKCWGTNGWGELNAPRGAFVAIDAGLRHTCAVTAYKAVRCWGQNTDGQADPPAEALYYDVACGDRHCCALRFADGLIDCWGDNSRGQLSAPRGRFTHITAGRDFTCASNRGSAPDPANFDVADTPFSSPTIPDSAIICWPNGAVEEPRCLDAPPLPSGVSISSGCARGGALGAPCQLACAEGFRAVGVASTICMPSTNHPFASYLVGQFSCEELRCPAPVLTRGVFVRFGCANLAREFANCNLGCAFGLIPTGTADRPCGINSRTGEATYGTDVFSCEEPNPNPCFKPALPNPNMRFVECPDQGTIGDFCQIECLPGFEPVGNLVLSTVCTREGSTLNSRYEPQLELTCEGTQQRCAAPNLNSNVKIESGCVDNAEIGSVCVVSCPLARTITPVVSVCSTGATTDYRAVEAFTCVAPTCAAPVLPAHTEVASGCQAGSRIGSQCTIRCVLGATLEGSQSSLRSTCQEQNDGAAAFAPTFFETCRAARCGRIELQAGQKPLSGVCDAGSPLGSTCTVGCIDGFNLIRGASFSAVSTCIPVGSSAFFSGHDFVCAASQCGPLSSGRLNHGVVPVAPGCLAAPILAQCDHTCGPGFIYKSGTGASTCTGFAATANYTSPTLQCTALTCQRPTSAELGDGVEIVSGCLPGGALNSDCTVRCANGFTGMGAGVSAPCLGFSEFGVSKAAYTGVNLTCTPLSCPIPQRAPDFPQGAVVKSCFFDTTANPTTFSPGSFCLLDCSPGLAKAGGAFSVAWCLSSSQGIAWTVSPFNCSAGVMCPAFPLPTNAVALAGESGQLTCGAGVMGDVCHLGCAANFVSSGVASGVCDPTLQRYTGLDTFQCIPLFCGSLPTIIPSRNVEVDTGCGQGGVPGEAECSVKCRSGFSASGVIITEAPCVIKTVGAAKIAVYDVQLTCTQKVCARPDVAELAEGTCQNLSPGQTCLLKCKPGFYPAPGSDLTAICFANTTFTGYLHQSTFSCIAMQCPIYSTYGNSGSVVVVENTLASPSNELACASVADIGTICALQCKEPELRGSAAASNRAECKADPAGGDFVRWVQPTIPCSVAGNPVCPAFVNPKVGTTLSQGCVNPVGGSLCNVTCEDGFTLNRPPVSSGCDATKTDWNPNPTLINSFATFCQGTCRIDWALPPNATFVVECRSTAVPGTECLLGCEDGFQGRGNPWTFCGHKDAAGLFWPKPDFECVATPPCRRPEGVDLGPYGTLATTCSDQGQFGDICDATCRFPATVASMTPAQCFRPAYGTAAFDLSCTVRKCPAMVLPNNAKVIEGCLEADIGAPCVLGCLPGFTPTGTGISTCAVVGTSAAYSGTNLFCIPTTCPPLGTQDTPVGARIVSGCGLATHGSTDCRVSCTEAFTESNVTTLTCGPSENGGYAVWGLTPAEKEVTPEVCTATPSCNALGPNALPPASEIASGCVAGSTTCFFRCSAGTVTQGAPEAFCPSAGGQWVVDPSFSCAVPQCPPFVLPVGTNFTRGQCEGQKDSRCTIACREGMEPASSPTGDVVRSAALQCSSFSDTLSSALVWKPITPANENRRVEILACSVIPRWFGCPRSVVSSSPQAIWTPPVLAKDETFFQPLRVTSTHFPGDTFPNGPTTVTYSASSVTTGTAATCSFVVFIGDPLLFGSFSVGEVGRKINIAFIQVGGLDTRSPLTLDECKTDCVLSSNCAAISYGTKTTNREQPCDECCSLHTVGNVTVAEPGLSVFTLTREAVPGTRAPVTLPTATRTPVVTRAPATPASGLFSLTCPADVTTTSRSPAFRGPLTGDPRIIAERITGPASGSPDFLIGPNLITFSATVAGTTATCSFTITVNGAATSGSCNNNCGQQASDCGCDYNCLVVGDCCSDFGAQCNGGSADSCLGMCDTPESSSRSCSCVFGASNLCSDFNAQCSNRLSCGNRCLTASSATTRDALTELDVTCECDGGACVDGLTNTCCADFSTTCDATRAEGSCQGKCGLGVVGTVDTPSFGCFCDAECTAERDCCADKTTACP